MSKLTLDALKERAETVATDELLLSISGGTENACHDNTAWIDGLWLLIKEFSTY